MIRSLRNLNRSFKYKVAICCIAKNEGEYLPEWIDYHVKIGVSHFYIYDNDSTVPIAATLSSYIKDGVVTVEHIAGREQQMPVHRHCLANYGSECQWIAFIDVDEFIVPKTLTGNLPEFLADYEKYGGLGVHWLIFGSNGNIEKPKAPQIESYTRRSLKTESINDHIKSIVQPRHVKRVPGDPHHFKYKLGKYCVNENFEHIKGPIVKHTSNKIQLNHYFLRSLEEFKLKIARGRADSGADRKLDEFYDLDKRANLINDESAIELRMIMNEIATV
jgi:hypothetical protein